MEMERLLVPLVFAISAAPVFVIAGIVARGNLAMVNGLDASRVRDPQRLARTLSRLLAGVGFAMLAGGTALLWADGDRDRVLWATVGMVLAVNGLAVALIVVVARAKRDYVDRRGATR